MNAGNKFSEDGTRSQECLRRSVGIMWPSALSRIELGGDDTRSQAETLHYPQTSKMELMQPSFSGLLLIWAYLLHTT